ncbi:putative protein [Arabidopsis thaliana]|nr:putative protein [Arabidopsis thaliana]CAA20208.1 putative protein [Arabidopsis thaliana]CAB81250.1 putative protein [Arabidopsis thaliana]
MSENEIVPDEFRCNRSDGKQWRCKRRALEGKKMCESHHSQQSLKRSKQKVAESSKLVRSRRGGGDEVASSEIEPNESRIRSKRLGKSKRKRVMGEAEAMDEAVKKMKLKRGDLQLDLIRMVLKREVEKRKRLPNSNNKKKSNGGFSEFVGEELTRVLPNGIMAISPPSPTTSNVSSPCDVKVGEEPISMIKRRFRSKNIEPLPIGKMQDSQSVRSDIDRVLHLHYAVCMLLPVLKEINAEHKVEVENDAEKKVDLQRMCTRSSSVLRLNSDQDQSQESLSRKVGSVKCSNGIKSPKVLLDFHQNNLEHFQTHWSKGHPVIVRSVIKSGSSLNWDPVALFCHYLMNRNNKTGNTTDCMDWFEVEIGVKQFFLGSLRGKAETNTCQERLKLEGWLSSSLFKEQFPNHYAEILNILPISHYMDPKRGLLNIAANLPDTVQPPDFGPCLNISYRSGEEYAQPDSVKKLGFETCDMVDILLYVTETPVSTNQICRIRKLMKNIGRVRSKNPAKGRESRFDKGKKRDRLDDYSSSDSESSQHCLGAKCRGSEFEGEERESCNYSCEEESLSNTYGAQWDVFQKQDVSKLLEYIKNHSLELESMDSSKKKVSHPLLEQSYYLDEYHKARLKEEFDVEPWSFDQCVGEAVILPAGCPYQIRKNKSCVNAVLKFLSPEHVSESIKRVKELNQLPQSVKSKANKIEVKKMAIHKISEAVKEIRELTSSDSTGALRLYN